MQSSHPNVRSRHRQYNRRKIEQVPKAKAIVATVYANGWRFSMAIICQEKEGSMGQIQQRLLVCSILSRGKSSIAII